MPSSLQIAPIVSKQPACARSAEELDFGGLIFLLEWRQPDLDSARIDPGPDLTALLTTGGSMGLDHTQRLTKPRHAIPVTITHSHEAMVWRTNSERRRSLDSIGQARGKADRLTADRRAVCWPASANEAVPRSLLNTPGGSRVGVATRARRLTSPVSELQPSFARHT
jgi:hypothetical protein